MNDHVGVHVRKTHVCMLGRDAFLLQTPDLSFKTNLISWPLWMVIASAMCERLLVYPMSHVCECLPF